MKRRRLLAGIIAIVAVLPSLGLPNTANADPCICTTCLGDINGNETVAGDEIAAFIDCLILGNTPGGDCACADMDGSGSPELADVSLFVSALLSPPTACLAQESLAEPPNGQPGNPMRNVYLFSGEFYERAVDLRIKARGFDFIWGRKYRSRIGPDTEMGNGWDYSYNRRIEQAGADMRLFDGNTRADRYRLRPDGTWARNEFFRVLIMNPDNSFTLTFPNKLQWNFNPLDGSPAEGKINSVIDRTGNTMTFDYDAAGRLTDVHDTLDGESPLINRVVTVGYDANGMISSVTDWIGRSVTYEYYDGIEPGGNLGDLKSVTTPAVTGTPHGNDFPAGKTTVYTYSTGFADERLNHNLLTNTDPKGQTFLTNTYAATTDPNALDFDRLTRQEWGDPGDILDVFYAALTPVPANNFATILAIVNDRVGNVTEMSSDKDNRCVLRREYTGRAPNPDGPTTDVANRPTGKLRPTDPDFFNTQYDWNCDSLLTRVLHPNQNEVQYVYDEANLSPRSRGNLLQKTRLPGALGGDQVQIVEFFEYDPGINFDHNLVTQYIDGRGSVASFVYDIEGNLTQATDRIASVVDDYTYNGFGQITSHTRPDNGSGHRRVDQYNYYILVASAGYLQSATVDFGGSNLTTSYEYDDVGNVIAVIDPRTHVTQFHVNQLDQVVRLTAREVTTGSGIRYERDVFFDENNNIVRLDVQNVDEAGVVGANSHFTTARDYDILNYQTRLTREVDPGHNIVTEYEFDDNRNRTLMRFGEATSGGDLGNIVRTLYDERNLIYHVIRAPGVPNPNGQSTTQHDYDGNRRVAKISQGLEDTPRETHHTYDGYDRLVMSTDPMGNDRIRHYDANGKLTSFRTEGELLDVPGAAGNVRLHEVALTYDAMDRALTREVEFFDANTQAPILVGPTPDGKVITSIVWSDNSQRLSVTDDDLHTTSTTYDTSNRVLTSTDSAGNTQTFSYNANSSVTTIREVDKSDLGSPDEIFVTTLAYDNLERQTGRTDNVGNVVGSQFDSRSNRTLADDAMRPVPGDPGNLVRYTYDGLNRLSQVERFLTNNGTGTGGLVGSIITAQAWDDTSRLVSRTDGNGNQTTYEYDSLNRHVRTIHQDTTQFSHLYDVHDNRVQGIDANGSLRLNTWDLNNRLTGRAITLAPGVFDTTAESFEYDGRARLVSAQDNDSLVARSYDSLSRVTQEDLTVDLGGPSPTTGTTVSVYDGPGNQLSCTYPGGRTITRTFDALDRDSAVSDAGGLLGTYDYIGPYRQERRRAGASAATIESNWAYDGIRRMTGSTLRNIVLPGTPILDDRTFAWNQMSNNSQRVNLLTGVTLDYAYDSIYRLVRSTRTPGGLVIDYLLDGVGDRISVIGGPAAGPYTKNPTMPEPADYQMNQYTTTPADARRSDKNGNLRFIDFGTPNQRNLFWSYRNLLVRHGDTATGIRTDYAYDALGRRIQKIVDVTGTPVTTRFFYDGLFVVEEQHGLGATTATYVKGVR